jgi:hypothetical protein
MKKNAILKKIDYYENKIMDDIHELQDFLDHIEDADISSMGNEFCEMLIDNFHENGTMTLNEIRNFVQYEYEI